MTNPYEKVLCPAAAARTMERPEGAPMTFSRHHLDNLLAVTASRDTAGDELVSATLDALAQAAGARSTSAFEMDPAAEELTMLGEVALESPSEPEEPEDDLDRMFWDAWLTSPVSWTDRRSPWYGKHPLDQPLDPSRMYGSVRAWLDAPMFRTFARAVDIGHHVLIPVSAGPGRVRRFCVERPLTDRPFDEGELTMLRLVQPHLDGALRRAQSGRPARELLSPRELEVLAYLRGGSSTKDVAGALWVSQSTVRKHLENIYSKLGVHGRLQAVAAVYGDSSDREVG